MAKVRSQAWLNAYRIVTIAMLLVVLTLSAVLVARPAPTTTPSAAEIARVVNPSEFTRPSAMEYVAKTDSIIVGGTVTYTVWHGKGVDVLFDSRTDDQLPNLGPDAVEYTEFGFKADNGQEFIVSQHGQLFTSPGENLGLELYGDSLDAQSYGLRAIIWGGK